MKPVGQVLIVGTRKGLFFVTTEDRKAWQLHGPFLKGKEINHATYDPQSRRIFATSNDAWFGCEIVYTSDFGETWTSARQSPAFTEASGNKLERLWHIEPAGGVLYAGVAPAALFKSEDNGESWSEITSLSSHPSRPHWHPGAGGLCLHSITVDPLHPLRMFVGISAVGVFKTLDGGKTWTTANKGTRAEFLPDKYPEYGQCVHKVLLSPADPKLLYQQNHCGMYRSDNDGAQWTEITSGLPSDFGFPLALHPRNKNTLYVIPLQGGEFRCPPEGKLRVFKSTDGGNNWTALTAGLPQENVFCGIYREGMCNDTHNPAGIYFGTNTGVLYGSIDEGNSWHVIAENLPPIFSVESASID